MWVDIAIIVIVVLGALIGLWRGFFKTLISFFGWTVSFVIAVLLTKPIAGALLDIARIKKFVVGTSGWSLFRWVYGRLPDLTGGGFLATVLKPLVKVAVKVGGDLKVNVALLLANGIFNVMVCVGIFLLIRLFLLLFTMFANAMTKGRFAGALNRLLGLILGAVKGTAFVAFVMAICTFFMGLSIMSPVRKQIDSGIFAPHMYKQVSRLTNKALSGNAKMLQKLLTFSGLDGVEYDPDKVERLEKAAGVYTYTGQDETDSSYSIELKKDGTFVQRREGQTENEYSRKGTFALTDTTVTFTYEADEQGQEQVLSGDIDIKKGWIRLDGKYLGKPDAELPQPSGGEGEEEQPPQEEEQPPEQQEEQPLEALPSFVSA